MRSSPLPHAVCLLASLGPGCAPPRSVGTPVLALDDSHPTVIIATWSDSDCVLHWGVDSMDREATGGTADLYGLAADTTASAQVDCAGTRGGIATITTGGVPGTVPTLDVISPLETTLAESYILTSGIAAEGHSVLLISDLDGKPVWWADAGMYVFPDPHYDPECECVYGVSWDDRENSDSLFVAPLAGPAQSYPVQGAHHDSLALGDGVYLVTRTEIQTVDGVLIAGDVLSVFDTRSGALTDVWDAFDQLEIVQNDGWQLLTPEGAADWTHANGLDRDPATGKIYLSLYFDESILQIDPTTWQTDWVLGGPQSDFEVPERFGPQHTPRFRDGVLWMFDNGSDVSAGSGPAAYEVDPDAMVATKVWSWAPEPAMFELVLGSVVPYDDAKLTSWGNTPEVRILLPDDTEGARYALRGAMGIGYTSFVNMP